MNFTQDRVRSIGWAFVLTVCCAVTMALTMRVNAVKSEVRLAERQIAHLKQEKMLLETELETRGNQQQLSAINDIEFGYQAPSAPQYIDGERQLAVLSKPRASSAPSPVRVAAALGEAEGFQLPAMVSPLTGRANAAEDTRSKNEPRVTTAAALADSLSQVSRLKVSAQ